MTDGQAPPRALLAFAEANLGRIISFRRRGWEHGVSVVWEVVGERGDRAFLKQCTAPAKFMREMQVYREWLPALPPVTPRLVAARGEPHWAMLLAAVPGRIMLEVETSEEDQRALHRNAGAFLRAMHNLPAADDDPLPIPDALRMRFRQWKRRARGRLPQAALDRARERFEFGDLFDGVARVVCHRDYSPRNWMIEPTGEGGWRWGVIDFEHTRLDVRHLDFLKLWDRSWVGRPDLEAAFFEGYGETLAEPDRERLERLAILHGISTVAWSVEHHDEEYEELGRTVLRRLGILTE